MTHYLLRLCTPNKEWGKAAVVLAEVHKDLPRADYGWARQMENKNLYFTCRKCLFTDEGCKKFQAWKEKKDGHEDDIEAEALKEGLA